MMINEALHLCGDQFCSLMFGAQRSCLRARFRSLSLFCVLPNEFKMDPSNRVNICSGALSLVFGACRELADYSFEYLSIATKRAGRYFKYGACLTFK